MKCEYHPNDDAEIVPCDEDGIVSIAGGHLCENHAKKYFNRKTGEIVRDYQNRKYDIEVGFREDMEQLYKSTRAAFKKAGLKWDGA